MRLHERIHAMRQRRRRLSLRDRLRRRRRIVELALSKSVPTERLKAAHTTRPPSRLVIAAGLKLVAVPIDSTRTRRSLASGSRARLPTPAEPERVAPVSASRSGPVPPGGCTRNGAGNGAVFCLVTIPATARSARAPHAVISARAAGSPSLSRRSTEENESCGLAGGKDASRLFVHPLVGVSSPGPGGFRMTDRRFYLLLTLLVLTPAAGEVVYAMVGPLSAPTHQVDDLSSINRVR